MQMRGVFNFEGSHTAVGSWLSQFMLCKLNSTTLKLSRWVCPDTNAQLSHLKNVDGALSHIQLHLFPVIGENPHNGLKYMCLPFSHRQSHLHNPQPQQHHWQSGYGGSLPLLSHRLNSGLVKGMPDGRQTKRRRLLPATPTGQDEGDLALGGE